MKGQAKRPKIVEAGGKAWIALLAECINSIGVEGFPQALVNALKSLVEFDYSVVFAYYQSEKPLCLFHAFSPKKRVVFVDDYLKGPYLLEQKDSVVEKTAGWRSCSYDNSSHAQCNECIVIHSDRMPTSHLGCPLPCRMPSL